MHLYVQYIWYHSAKKSVINWIVCMCVCMCVCDDDGVYVCMCVCACRLCECMCAPVREREGEKERQRACAHVEGVLTYVLWISRYNCSWTWWCVCLCAWGGFMTALVWWCMPTIRFTVVLCMNLTMRVFMIAYVIFCVCSRAYIYIYIMCAYIQSD